MTCRSLEHAIVEVARGRDVGRGTTAAVESHVEQCAACAARLAREQRLTDGLRALATATGSAAPSDALEERLMAAFAAEHTPSRPKWVVPAAAAAAVIVIGLGWWMAPQDIPARPAAVNGPPPVARMTPPTVTPPSTSEAPTPADVTRLRAAGRRRPSPARQARGDAGFIALPAAIGLPDFESGVIVRMELPVAALPAYGFEIVPGRKTPIEADLLIGQDGQARAIRLVSRSIARSGAEQ